jgi:hypothetical protein
MVPTALQVPWRQASKITSASGIADVFVALGGYTNGHTAPTKIFSIIASNTDTVVRDIQLIIVDNNNPGLFTLLGAATIPANAGVFGNTLPVNVLNSLGVLPLDETGQAYIFMNPNDVLYARVTTNLNSGFEIHLNCFGADF